MWKKRCIGQGTSELTYAQIRPRNRQKTWQAVKRAKGLYLLLVIPVLYVLVFNYAPMYGVLIAFKRFSPRQGILGSPWVGFYNFERFFTSANFWPVIRNTVVLAVYGLLVSFPVPILLALGINHSFSKKFGKFVQTTTFAPYFISTVILVGLMTQLLNTRVGIVNHLISALGFQTIDFMGNPAYFRHIYVWSGVWSGAGNGAIIYIATLASVDPTLHEAAVVDGANVWQRIRHIDLPSIQSIVLIMLILSMGSLISVGFDKVYLLQNPMNLSISEVIETYVYKVGIMSSRPDYSFATAIGLFQNVISVILVLTANKVVDKLTGSGLL